MSEESTLTSNEAIEYENENAVTQIESSADKEISKTTIEPAGKDADSAGKSADLTEKAALFSEKAADYTEKAAEFTGKAADYTEKTFKKVVSHIKGNEEYDEISDDDAPGKKRFHFRKGDKEFFRDKWILSRISDENLMEYLTLEQKRNELQQQAKDIKEKRIFRAFEITVALAAIVAVIYLLRDNPTILVNILYIAGIVTAFWFWKKPQDK